MASWVMGVVGASGYVGLLLLMVAENLFPPIPSELILPLAGYMASQEQLKLSGVIVAATAGAVMGALPLYWLGRSWGEERMKDFADRHGRWLTLSRSDIEGAKRWFDRHGAAATFFCRLVPGVRSLISVPAGIARMSLPLFLTCTTAGAALWSTLLAFAGHFVGSRFERVAEYLDPLSWIAFATIAGAYAYRVARHKGVSSERTA